VGFIARDDFDAISDVAFFEITADGWTSASVKVSEMDNDRLAIVSDSATINVSENGRSLHGIKLASKPASTVVVESELGPGDPDILILSGQTLFFTPENWAEPQFVDIAAVDDIDSAAGQRLLISSAAGWMHNEVIVRELDDERRIEVVTETGQSLVNRQIGVMEGNASRYGLVLSSVPIDPVTVRVNLDSVTTDPNIQFVGPTSFTFTAANWNVPQLFSVAAVDDLDGENGTAMLQAVAQDWVPATAQVCEVDNDRRIIVSSTQISVNETGVRSVVVQLGGRPASDVVITAAIRGDDGDIVIATGNQLIFNSSNWQIPQQIVLAAHEDLDAVDGADRLIVSALGWTGADVQVLEIDLHRNIRVTNPVLELTEGDFGPISSADFGVLLGGRPDGVVEATITKIQGSSAISIPDEFSHLQFNVSDWIVAKSVFQLLGDYDRSGAVDTADYNLWRDQLGKQVTPGSGADGNSNGSIDTVDYQVWRAHFGMSFAPKDEDAQDETAEFAATSPGWGSASFIVHIRDIDRVIQISADPVNVEEGSTVTIQARLGGRPDSAVAVNVELSGDEDIQIVSGATLFFSESNWNS
jgi:hypothetical protein